MQPRLPHHQQLKNKRQKGIQKHASVFHTCPSSKLRGFDLAEMKAHIVEFDRFLLHDE